MRPVFLPCLTALLGLCALFHDQLPASGQEPVRLEQRFAAGDQYRVKTRSEVSGSLTFPPEARDKPAPPPLTIRGDSVVEYDERVLGLTATGQVQKTVRICGRIEFRRTVGDHEQGSTLRPSVRRLVVLREGSAKAPFSPDGPLTWGEIDLVRTDTFVPVLTGLLPAAPVKPGETWPASADAVQELTGLTRLGEGRLECRLEQVSAPEPHRLARVALSGTVRGLSDDGASSQQLKGHFTFDLDAGGLTFIEVRGVHSLLAADGREAGRIEGRFLLSCQPAADLPGLTDAALRGVTLDPDAENSLLLYDNPDLGVRFIYPRRWKVAGVKGNQLGVDAPDGSGFLLTVEAVGRAPTGPQFLAEARDYLVKQKAQVLRIDPPRTVQADPPREHFALEVEITGQKFLMDYHVSRQANGGAVLAARLLPRELEALQREVEQIARSIVITKRIEDRR